MGARRWHGELRNLCSSEGTIANALQVLHSVNSHICQLLTPYQCTIAKLCHQILFRSAISHVDFRVGTVKSRGALKRHIRWVIHIFSLAGIGHAIYGKWRAAGHRHVVYGFVGVCIIVGEVVGACHHFELAPLFIILVCLYAAHRHIELARCGYFGQVPACRSCPKWVVDD